MSRSLFKGFSFLVVLIPFVYIVYQAALSVNGVENALGADPGQAIVKYTGKWALHAVVIILAISPLIRIGGLKQLVSIRRMLGLFVFFYASLHLLCFWLFILVADINQLLIELTERPYITVGFAAWFVFLLLALTSNRYSQRKLQRNWKRLHQGVYWAAALTVVHFYWLSRSDIGEVLFYAFLMLFLLFLRLPFVAKVMGKFSLQFKDKSID